MSKAYFILEIKEENGNLEVSLTTEGIDLFRIIGVLETKKLELAEKLNSQ
tara:strand:+ start:34074 stop:34223 length:150 start_codon:yes stop_codon:yes gene_type:complete